MTRCLKFFSIKKLGEKRGAFTITEVLVVISIISVLTALILPAVEGAKESSRSVQCINNLRQMGVAISLYGEEYDVYLEAAQPGSGPNPIPWYVTLGPYLSCNTTLNPDGRTASGLSPIFECPSKKIKVPGADPVNTYGIMRSLVGNEYIYPHTERTSEMILVIDATQFSGTGLVDDGWSELSIPQNRWAYGSFDLATAEDPADPGPDQDTRIGLFNPRWRHTGKANAVFVDGHVAVLRKEDYKLKNVATPP